MLSTNLHKYQFFIVLAVSLLVATALFAIALTTAAVAQQPGDLDPTFSGDGKLTDGISVGQSERAYSVAVQPDGKIVAGGYRSTGANNGANYEFAIVRYNPDGSLDTTFDGDGNVATPIGGFYAEVRALAIQTDGKIVAAGSSTTVPFALVRYNADGSLDATFGSGGKVSTYISSGQADSVAIQLDGKIVVAGHSHCESMPYEFTVIRYYANGSLDASFGGDGTVVTPFGESDAFARGVAIQTDGKIVVGGSSYNDSTGYDLTAVRYNTDGSLDATFGIGGKAVTDLGRDLEEANSVAIQVDGKIVVAGGTRDNSNYYGSDFAVVRYNINGSLDSTFDDDGKVVTDIGGYFDTARSVAIQTDGKIVAAGPSGYNAEGYANFAVVRHNPDGSLDTSFEGDGTVTTNIELNNDAFSVAIQSDGKIVAAGECQFYEGDFALARYNTDGSLDTTFDGDGKVTTDSGGWSGNRLFDVITQLDGRIVAAGHSQNDLGYYQFTVVRYNADGSPDTSFDSDGKVITDLGAGSDSAQSLAIQTDGKIVAAGTSNDDFAVVRYNGDGSLDTTFDGDGKVRTPIGTSGDYASSVAIQTDGKIVTAGYTYNGDFDFAVARYNTNGSLDTSFDSDGIVTTPGGIAYSLAIQADGKLVTAGASQEGFVVVRYNASGSLDTSFGGNGIVVTPIGAGGFAFSVAIQPDGKIVAAGSSSNGPDGCIAIVRYNSNGSLDTTFDSDGILITSVCGVFVSSGPAGGSVEVETSGKLVVASSSNGDFAVARYNAEGSIDTTFGGGDGVSTVDFDNTDDVFRGMALDGPGRAVMVGDSNGAFAVARFMLEPGRAPYDFDGDGKSDISVFRPSNSVWYLHRSTDGFYATQFGNSTDKIVPADYDGDGKTDIAIFRDGAWWRIDSRNSTVEVVQFGMSGDVPIPGDYNGDGRDEVAVYRNGEWWREGVGRTNFGLPIDKPVPADYDGDGKDDIAVFRPSDGTWWIDRSTAGLMVVQFGQSGDKTVPGDYTGDGQADVAVWRPSNGSWYVLRSEDLSYFAFPFGQNGDLPAPADFDGDGKADIAVYRDGTWYVLKADGGVTIQQFGLAGDKPVPSAYLQ